eukprot:GGOE01009497.1.p1 GENE.GGOE01009497.1~~GGOE01009497.1.p1  ORF type:complete len:367 (+),score=56.20 GGOE01009497.1:71-1171(+)
MAGRNGTLVVHDAESWRRRFRRASEDGDCFALRSLRVEIIKQTLQAMRVRRYRSCNDAVVELFSNPRVVELFAVPSMPSSLPGPGPCLSISVRNGDCLEVAEALQKEGMNPVVMNMACARSPGGGFMTGAGAQEENLFRRSDYASHLLKAFYPIDQQVVYTANIKVFRSSEASGYALLPRPFPVSFIAVAADHKPRLIRDARGQQRLNDDSAKALKRKLQTFCAAAAKLGHISLVLSALGCGAFCNPPEHVAEIFADVLAEYGAPFCHVVFAIFDDHNTRRSHNPAGNLRPFMNQFLPPPSVPCPSSSPTLPEGSANENTSAVGAAAGTAAREVASSAPNHSEAPSPPLHRRARSAVSAHLYSPKT